MTNLIQLTDNTRRALHLREDDVTLERLAKVFTEAVIDCELDRRRTIPNGWN